MVTSRNPERVTHDRATVRESDLCEAVIVALESGEFRQVRGRLRQGRNGACVWGVAYAVAWRANMSTAEARRELEPAMTAAGRSLGYAGIECANDAGCTFPELAQALRQVRQADS